MQPEQPGQPPVHPQRAREGVLEPEVPEGAQQRVQVGVLRLGVEVGEERHHGLHGGVVLLPEAADDRDQGGVALERGVKNDLLVQHSLLLFSTSYNVVKCVVQLPEMLYPIC